jgi:hypothetical protein
MNSIRPPTAPGPGLRHHNGPRCRQEGSADPRPGAAAVQVASATLPLQAAQRFERLTPMGCTIKKVVEHVADHTLAVDHVGDTAGQQPQHRGNTEGTPQSIAAVN